MDIKQKAGRAADPLRPRHWVNLDRGSSLRAIGRIHGGVINQQCTDLRQRDAERLHDVPERRADVIRHVDVLAPPARHDKQPQLTSQPQHKH